MLPISRVKYTLIDETKEVDVSGMRKLRVLLNESGERRSQNLLLNKLKSIHCDVCSAMRIDYEMCMQKNRKSKFVMARHIVASVARTFVTGSGKNKHEFPLKTISKFYSMSSHATVLNGCHIVYNCYKVDPLVRKYLSVVIENSQIEYVRQACTDILNGVHYGKVKEETYIQK